MLSTGLAPSESHKWNWLSPADDSDNDDNDRDASTVGRDR